MHPGGRKGEPDPDRFSGTRSRLGAIAARQFAFMVKYGMTPMQAIQSATINAADLIGKPDQFGSIRAGKFADLIAVDGDPIVNVRQLEHVTFVMKEGVVYKQ